MRTSTRAAERQAEAEAAADDRANAQQITDALAEGVRLTKIWVVTTPTIHSLLDDFCYETDPQTFALSVLGGLKPDEILGVFTGAPAARAFAVEQVRTVADRIHNQAIELEAQAAELRRRAEVLK